MNTTTKKVGLWWGIIGFLYLLLFYFVVTNQLRLDFYSFYQAAIEYSQNINPYHNLKASFLPTPIPVPVNLNPPLFLELMLPLTHLHYKAAAIVWTGLSITLGIIGALITFFLTGTHSRKNCSLFLLIYLSMYATILNLSIGQVGNFLLFFIIAGYYFYLRQNNILAGVFWGVISTIKLFPALIIFFVISQKRYKTLGFMLGSSLLVMLIPLMTHGFSMYEHYVHLIPQINWYGDSWNASLQGFIYRLFGPIKGPAQQNLVKACTLSVFFVVLFWYIKKLIDLRANSPKNHQAFALTLVLMLLLSPLGWLYYFPMLLLPLMLTWQRQGTIKNQSSIHTALWVSCLFLINMPIGYIEVKTMHSFALKVSLYSSHFYGLVLLLYFLNHQMTATESISHEQSITRPTLFALQTSVALGLCVSLLTMVLHLINLSAP